MLVEHILSNINLIMEGHDNEPKDVVAPLIPFLMMVFDLTPSDIQWPELVMSVEEDSDEAE